MSNASTVPPAPELTRVVKFPGTDRTHRALKLACEVTGDGPAVTGNRAVQVYAYVVWALSQNESVTFSRDMLSNIPEAQLRDE